MPTPTFSTSGRNPPSRGRYLGKPFHVTDAEKIRAAAQRLTGKHDFASFVVGRANIGDAVRAIFRIDIPELSLLCRLTFVGGGFLYRMIRCFNARSAGTGQQLVRRIF